MPERDGSLMGHLETRRPSASMPWVIAVATVGVLSSGCSCAIRSSPSPCDEAEAMVEALCEGVDTGGWTCRYDRDACRDCVDDHFTGGGDCWTLGRECEEDCCPGGWLCGDDDDLDAGPEDAGADQDAGPPPACGDLTQMGGACRSGTVCATGLTCFEELTAIPSTGAPLTVGNAFGIREGMEDPSNPGEYVSTGVESDVPIGFAPGGLCSQACNPAAADDGCGMCAECSRTLGGGRWDAVGITVRSFDVTMTTNDIRPGVCRLNCQWSATRNDCPSEYACDAGENVCVEACVADSQCNVGLGLSRSEGYVTYELEGAPYACNPTTGNCEWIGPASAGLNTACEDDADCPYPGVCLIGGYCATVACADNAGMLPGPVECAGDCIGFGGNNGSVCVRGCMTPDDCNPGQACSAIGGTLPSGNTGFCFAVCEDDSECRATERCRAVPDDPRTALDESLSVCEAFCDPPGGATLADAIACGAGEVCSPVDGAEHGFCDPLEQLCFADGDCHGTQACEVLGDDLYGRCVDGCASDADCTGGERCRRQAGEGGLEPFGVCRADMEPCAPSPLRTDGSVIQPLRGDAQCPPGRACSETEPDVVGACTGTPPVPDGGATDAGPLDAG